MRRNCSEGLIEKWTLLVAVILICLSPSVSWARNDAYRIGIGDSLSIQVWDEPKLTQKQSVLPDGTITFPLIGSLHAAGLTTEELSRHIAHRLNFIFRKRPDVTVVIARMGNNFFYISGAIKKPGVIGFDHPIRLLQAIILAGGPTLAAKEDSVVVIRNNKPRTISIEELDQGSDLSANIPIMPQDIIIVPTKTEEIYIMGEVTTPGPYYYNKKMTVLQALIQAHGFTQYASLGSVRIIRQLKNGTKKIIHVDIDEIENEKKIKDKEYLMPGDFIYVPQRMF